MRTDNNDPNPEDVEAHRRHFFGEDQSQATEQSDTGQDVEAHMPLRRDASNEPQATEQSDTGQDV
jgi:hypothetical protein